MDLKTTTRHKNKKNVDFLIWNDSLCTDVYFSLSNMLQKLKNPAVVFKGMAPQDCEVLLWFQFKNITFEILTYDIYVLTDKAIFKFKIWKSVYPNISFINLPPRVF
jgi:hypothetical protein